MSAAQGNALSAVGAAQGVGISDASNTAQFADTAHSLQALRAINGEQQARRYLARLQAQHVDQDELAACVAMLSDAVSLAGFCRVIEKALGVRS